MKALDLNAEQLLSGWKKLDSLFSAGADNCLDIVVKAPTFAIHKLFLELSMSRKSSLLNPILVSLQNVWPVAALDPIQLLSHNCIIFGDDPDRTFVVKIQKSKSVNIFKDVIKEKKSSRLKDIDASDNPEPDLDLWMVNFLIDNLPSKNPSTPGPKLRPEKLLSELFPSGQLLSSPEAFRI